MLPSTLNGINRLSEQEKRRIYSQVIPRPLIDLFHLNPPEFKDEQGRDLLMVNCPAGSHTAEMALYHCFGFPDPVFYGHITDTLNGQLHILLYVLNNPDSPRYDVDRLPGGASTQLGAESRNLAAELAAMQAGLSPGQVRRGLRLLGSAIQTFEVFVNNLGHDLYFAEPLYYHNAIIFERYGFSYEKGKKLMERIQKGFSPEGDLTGLLNNSTPFRTPQAAGSIRLRSWAIHDGILGEPFTNVTMYKRVNKKFDLSTCNGCPW
ncbi:MAG: hypothetical protein ACM3PY_03825 [Omnitrophica WOR_2 bacterium]